MLNQPPTTLFFEIGGLNSACYQIDYKQGHLKFRRAVGAFMWEPEMVLEPDSGAWVRFWKVVEAAGVWRWEKHYENPEILDGAQWFLKLKYQGRGIKSSGSNAFPGSQEPDFSETCEFGQFIKGLRELTGETDIG